MEMIEMEEKRFTCDRDFLISPIEDWFKHDTIMNAKTLLEVMNELHDENQQLKKQLEELSK